MIGHMLTTATEPLYDVYASLCEKHNITARTLHLTQWPAWPNFWPPESNTVISRG